MRKFLSTLILFSSVSCSSIFGDSLVEKELDGQTLIAKVYLARGFIGGSEYERYYLQGDVLWRECGEVSKTPLKVRAPLRGDSVFPPDVNHKIVERHVEALNWIQLRSVKSHVDKLLESTRKQGDFSRIGPPPGPIFKMSDPGTVEVSASFGFDTAKVLTSVDAVSDKNEPNLAQLQKMISTIRGIGPVMCDSRTFYGIP